MKQNVRRVRVTATRPARYPFIVSGVDTVVNNTKVCSVVTDMQQWVPLALILRTSVNKNTY